MSASSAADDKEIAEAVDNARRECEKLLSSGNSQKALTTALAVPVSKDEKVKLMATQSVSNAVAVIKEADIQKTLDTLSDEERLQMMKYCYRGMATGQNCSAWLRWHGALYEKDGVGTIMRTIVDRNL